MEPIEIITDVSQHIASRQKLIIEQVQAEIDAYWDWFSAENTRISGLHKTGQATKESGPHINNVAPVIEYRGNAGYSLKKPYIIWKNFSQKFRRNLTASSDKAAFNRASIPLHSYNVTDASKVLRTHCTWNASRAIELESKLSVFREALNGLHELVKKANATTRKITRLTQAKGE